MQFDNLSEVIRKIRNTPGIKRRKSSTIFPYTELYGRYNNIDTKKIIINDPKQILMQRIRDKFQIMENPYQHQKTLKKPLVETILPKMTLKIQNSLNKYNLSNKNQKIPKINYSPNSTPYKKNILFYRPTQSTGPTRHFVPEIREKFLVI
jgi:hypothetical protein